MKLIGTYQEYVNVYPGGWAGRIQYLTDQTKRSVNAGLTHYAMEQLEEIDLLISILEVSPPHKVS